MQPTPLNPPPGQHCPGPVSPQGSIEIAPRSKALDPKPGVTRFTEPWKIAASRKRSAEAARRRSAEPLFPSTHSMFIGIDGAARASIGPRRLIFERAMAQLRANI
ncbi:MAG TPA: DUF3175 domain-containing protein [Candidatus Dormibacteraeota bacterium]|nr:DUF3175 domain-containing protein [Candidatus Dormibacteraeota bacterium]